MNIYQSSQHLFQENVLKMRDSPEFKCRPRDLFIHENIGFAATITDPRKRSIYSKLRRWDIAYAIGETIWYLRGAQDLKMIKYYAPSYGRFSDNGTSLYGAYGPRLRDQYNTESNVLLYHYESSIQSVIRKLQDDRDSRQALALIWRQKDMHVITTKDLPCTICLQFFIRDDKLHTIATMRSNDLWIGASYDIYTFTFIQEYIAGILGIDVGHYHHQSGSMHLYERDLDKMSECKDLEKNIISNYEHLNELRMDQHRKGKDYIKEKFEDLFNFEKTIRLSDTYIIPELDDEFFYHTKLVLLYRKLRKLYKKNNHSKFTTLFITEVLDKMHAGEFAVPLMQYEGVECDNY